MVVARASGTLMASSLKQNKFWAKLLLWWRDSARARAKIETIIGLLFFGLRNSVGVPPPRVPMGTKG